MLFAAGLASEEDFHPAVLYLIRGRIHRTSAGGLSVSWDLFIHMTRNEAIRTMIPAGFGGLLNLFTAIDTYKTLINLFHYNRRLNVKATKRLNDMVSFYNFSMYLYIMILMCLQVSTNFLESSSSIYFLVCAK
jgi:hypothetical protein